MIFHAIFSFIYDTDRYYMATMICYFTSNEERYSHFRVIFILCHGTPVNIVNRMKHFHALMQDKKQNGVEG